MCPVKQWKSKGAIQKRQHRLVLSDDSFTTTLSNALQCGHSFYYICLNVKSYIIHLYSLHLSFSTPSLNFRFYVFSFDFSQSYWYFEKGCERKWWSFVIGFNGQIQISMTKRRTIFYQSHQVLISSMRLVGDGEVLYFV